MIPWVEMQHLKYSCEDKKQMRPTLTRWSCLSWDPYCSVVMVGRCWRTEAQCCRAEQRIDLRARAPPDVSVSQPATNNCADVHSPKIANDLGTLTSTKTV